MAVKETISFVGYEADAGQPYQIIRLKEKIAEAEIAFPQTLTVNLAGKTEPETFAVSWQTAEDYANSTYDTYIFTPVWDTSEYELAFENDMSPFIEVQITQGIEENLTNTINNTYSNVITLGTGGTYANFSALFDEPSIQGDVVVSLTSDINETKTATPLIIPKRFTSLTIQSDSSGTQRAFNINEKNEFSIEEMNSLYANGCSLIIGKDIVFGSPVNEWKYNNASIYGGGYKEDVTGNTNIEFNGVLKQGNIFGGGFNSNVDGNTKVTISGEVYGIVAGGGYAHADNNITSNITINADVSGSTVVNTNEDSYAAYVRGGGFADLNLTSNYKVIMNAKVGGNVTVTIDGQVCDDLFSVIAGGYVKCNPQFNYEAELNADISGNVNLTFKSNARSEWDPFGVYGGGYAESAAGNNNLNNRNVSASAKVYQNVTIIAAEDSMAGDYEEYDEQDYARAFRCLYGGGYASGLGSDVTVNGNTIITTARPVFEGVSGVYGGGYAVKSGTADVKGTTHITIQKINGQYYYENANGVFGGGHAESSYDPENFGNTFKISQANVGGTEITIKTGAVMESGNSNPGISVLGGGFADGSVGKADNYDPDYFEFVDSAYDKCPVIAKVLGNVKITIEDNVKLVSGLIGGGAVNLRGDATVTGSVDVVLGDNCKVVAPNYEEEIGMGNFIGGGYVYYNVDKNLLPQDEPEAIADVLGNVTAVFGNNSKFGRWFVGGGYTGSGTINAQANIKGNFTNTFNGNVTVTNYFIGKGYATGESASAEVGTKGNSNVISTYFNGNGASSISTGSSLMYCSGYSSISNSANINGTVNLVFNGSIPTKTVVGGGYSITGESNIDGNLNVVFKDFTAPLTTSIYSGGVAKTRGQSKISGSLQVEYNNLTINNFNYGAVLYSADANVDIDGDEIKIFKDVVTEGKYIGGSWGMDASHQVNVKGSSIINLQGGNQITGAINSGGYAFSTVNKALFNITGNQNSPIQILGIKNNCTITNGIEVNIGDGTNSMQLESYYISGADKVNIAKNATLSLADEPLSSEAVNTNHLFWDVKNLTIQEGGKLSLVNSSSTIMQEAISNEYIGNGTLVLEAGKSLSIGGTAAGTTQLEIQGSPAKDQVYVTVANGGSEIFNYTSDSLNLNKEESGNTHTWKLVEAEIPVNSISGITEGKEYFKGDTLAFTALGNGMENNTPSLNNKRWLPSKCLIDTTEINLDSAYSGTINTTNLSTGAHKLSITFTEQRYDGSNWSNTGRDDIKEVTFTLKEKSSTPSSGGGSYAPSTKKEGFVENSGKTYYYINGKPADNGFILLDKDQQLVQALSPDQFIQKPTTADAVYYIKEDRTIAKNEWVVLDQNGNFVDTMPLNEFKDAYGEEYKLYAAREDGQLVQSWLEVNGVWFYFLEDYSARYQYWQAHWNDWYLFEHYTYVTNRWQPTSEGRWYYLDSEGRMVRNQWIDGCWIDEYGIYWSPIYTPEND
ncbi:hypothetical protein [Dielma fastidiosa]|nr:hypothetical protein [Dielma fastidiosa]